ncbi:hypothetical protein MLD38_025150 [Melastoma candidum]|uniref:Uncharacterized protein n=1 Tax=Melastoma candidum TaxID=119954 RepID=A0ACB9NUH1_9MYRT|nr:hypothetical protein MLD38_025150 [Melastoma candidum]
MGNVSGSISGEECEEISSLDEIHAPPVPVHSSINIEPMYAGNQRPMPVMITWCHGGRQVAVTGSWDNWQQIEPMHISGKEFVLVKLLPSGVYHYRFVVDGNPMYDEDAPSSFIDPGGNTYNMLDVEEFAAEPCENVPEHNSPEESYGRNSIHDIDFSKPPPDLPPQMYKPLLNDSPPSWPDVHQLLARPPHVVLNHLYVKGCERQAVALGSTHRFLKKYVTVILYKPSIHRR